MSSSLPSDAKTVGMFNRFQSQQPEFFTPFFTQKVQNPCMNVLFEYKVDLNDYSIGYVLIHQPFFFQHFGSQTILYLSSSLVATSYYTGNNKPVINFGIVTNAEKYKFIVCTLIIRSYVIFVMLTWS